MVHGHKTALLDTQGPAQHVKVCCQEQYKVRLITLVVVTQGVVGALQLGTRAGSNASLALYAALALLAALALCSIGTTPSKPTHPDVHAAGKVDLHPGTELLQG